MPDAILVPIISSSLTYDRLSVPGHAYALLRAATTSTGVNLVEMRNPWGQGGMEWNGDWSDKSPLWTETLKVRCGILG